MAELDNRNSPFSPFSVDSVTEVLLPPYRGEKVRGILGIHKIFCSGGLAFAARDLRDVLCGLEKGAP